MGRFCSNCGFALQSAPSAPPPSPNTVNVTVNVGPPTITNMPPGEAKVAPAARGLLQSLQRSLEDRAARRRELDRLRQEAHVKLGLCDDLIAEIEHSLALELLSAGSPARQQYMHGLETRRDGAALLDRATSIAEVAIADAMATQALHELRTTRYALASGGQ